MKLNLCISFRSIRTFYDTETNACLQQQHYEVLGLEKNATTEEIKKAYLSLARQYHPDKCSNEEKIEATEHFKKINEAYTILSDEERRKRFDQFLETTQQPQFVRQCSMSRDQAMTVFVHFFGESFRRQQEIQPSMLSATLSFALPATVAFVMGSRPEAGVLAVYAGIISMMSINNAGYEQLVSTLSPEEKEVFLAALTRLLDSQYFQQQ